MLAFVLLLITITAADNGHYGIAACGLIATLICTRSLWIFLTACFAWRMVGRR
jgi:hypothetical protein